MPYRLWLLLLLPVVAAAASTWSCCCCCCCSCSSSGRIRVDVPAHPFLAKIHFEAPSFNVTSFPFAARDTQFFMPFTLLICASPLRPPSVISAQQLRRERESRGHTSYSSSSSSYHKYSPGLPTTAAEPLFDPKSSVPSCPCFLSTDGPGSFLFFQAFSTSFASADFFSRWRAPSL